MITYILSNPGAFNWSKFFIFFCIGTFFIVLRANKRLKKINKEDSLARQNLITMLLVNLLLVALVAIVATLYI